LKAEDRLNMVRDMFKNSENVEVSDCEISSKCDYAIDTLNHFKKIYPKAELYFILGTDLLKDFDKWKNYELVLKKYGLLVISRDNDGFHEIMKKYDKYSNKVLLTKLKTKSISSSMVRSLILKKGYTDELRKYLYVSTIKYLKGINVKRYWK
jgi:nicotinate-nucleotide adenylyltransferase